jgi:hypothetical protein
VFACWPSRCGTAAAAKNRVAAAVPVFRSSSNTSSRKCFLGTRSGRVTGCSGRRSSTVFVRRCATRCLPTARRPGSAWTVGNSCASCRAAQCFALRCRRPSRLVSLPSSVSAVSAAAARPAARSGRDCRAASAGGRLVRDRNGLLEEAIGQVLAGAGAAAAGHLLAHHRNALSNRKQRHRLERCLRLLPADSIELDPELLLLKAWLMHHQGRHRESPAVLDRIEALVAGDAAVLEALHGSVLALRSVHSYLEGRADVAVTQAEQALRCLPVDCLDACVIAQAVVAGARQMSGDLVGARQWIHEALARAPGPIDVCQAPLVASLCFIDWMAADLCRAAVDGQSAYPLLPSNRLRQPRRPWRSGCYFHGLVHYQRNELALAEATLAARPGRAAARAPASRLSKRNLIWCWRRSIRRSGRLTGRARSSKRLPAIYGETAISPACFVPRPARPISHLRQGRIDQAREWARNFDPGPFQLVYRFFNAPHLTWPGCGLPREAPRAASRPAVCCSCWRRNLPPGTTSAFCSRYSPCRRCCSICAGR